MLTEDNSEDTSKYFDKDWVPYTLEELLDACKYNPEWYLEMLQISFIDTLDEAEDDVDKAEGYMDIAMLGHMKLSYDLLLDLIFKALKIFPRVHSGMQYLVEISAESILNREGEEEELELRFQMPHAALLKALLILSKYSSERIDNIIFVKQEPSREEEQVIEDLTEVCKALDKLFFTWEPEKDKRVLYDILCTRIEPRYAAVLTITLEKLLPPPIVRAFYYNSGTETALKEIEKDEESQDISKYYALLAENEKLKQEIEKLKKEREESQKKQGKPPLKDFGLN